MRLSCCAVLAACLLPVAAHAQRVKSRTVTARPIVTGVDSADVARLQLADTFMRAAQYDRAILLLEDLLAETPGTKAYFAKLQESYEAVKRYDDAIALVDRQLSGAPAREHLDLRAEKARLTYLKGDEIAALGLWELALHRSPTENRTYRTVYNSLLRVRLLDRAVDVLERGRREIGNETLFQAELASLYGLTGDHGKAMAEYLGLLSDNERQLNYVRNRLGRALEQQGALDASIAAVERRLGEVPQNRSVRDLLGWLYMEAGAYPKALIEYRAIDRLERESGHVLFDFARRAAEAGAYAIALEAFDEVLAAYPDTPIAAEAQLGLARMHRLWAESTRERAWDEAGNRRAAPHYDAALEASRVFLQRFPDHARAAQVLHDFGQLQRDVYFDMGEAAATLAEVIAVFPGTEAAARAELDLGRISLARGNLEEARLVFARLAERTATIAEEARWEQALIHYYRGEFDIVRSLIARLDERTSNDVANDAIALKVLLIENAGPDSLDAALRALAGAALLLRQRRAAEAAEAVDGLLREFGAHPIADDARFLRARALREDGRLPEALLAFGEIPLIHPQSPLCDRSLFALAEITDFELGDPGVALKAYTDLIVRYPGSPLAAAARERIRALRNDGA